MVNLEARMDAAYQNNYHPAIQGRIWNSLEGTDFIKRHDAADPPGFAYSNPFPPGDMEEGDQRKLIISSVDEGLLAHVAADLLDEREFNIKQMPFNVENISDFTVDVGEPGTTGVISCGTGLLIKIPHWDLDRYGIEHPKGASSETPVYWRPKYGMEVVRQQIERNLEYKHNLYGSPYTPTPSETEYDLFEGYDLIKQFAVPIQVSSDYEQEYVLSKWRFDYQVQDAAHREHLNLALNLGLGAKNGMGLGFINIQEKSKPHEREGQVTA